MLGQRLVSVTASAKIMPVISSGFSCLHISDSHLLPHSSYCLLYIISYSSRWLLLMFLWLLFFAPWNFIFGQSRTKCSDYNVSDFLLWHFIFPIVSAIFVTEETYRPCVKYVRNSYHRKRDKNIREVSPLITNSICYYFHCSYLLLGWPQASWIITIKFNKKKLDFYMWRDFLFHIHFNLSWVFFLTSLLRH